ncbi:MAG TPA: hypothetical protein VMS43_05380 [Allosphingosinicella sp.]|nr:hypothetical protein [Allosphingosinicella sp.]
MIKIRSVRRLAGLMLLLAGLQPAPTSAQPRPDIPADAIRVPCCRCLDGHQQVVNINTRTAPWQVGSPGSTGVQPVVAAGNVSWYPVPPAGWVGPPGNPTAVGDYTYFIRIYVPRCTIPGRVILSGRFGADNSARVFLDSGQIAASQGTPNYGFLQGSITPFSTPVGPGVHTLRVVVRNIGGPTGMILQGQLTFTCPRDLEQ